MAPPARISEAARLRAEIAQARRRRDAARGAVECLKAKVAAEEAARAQLASGTSGQRSLAAAPGAQVEAGARVRVVGYSEAPSLNGQQVEVLAKDVKRGRCKVKLASGEQRQLPATCLEPESSRGSVPALAIGSSAELAQSADAQPLLSTHSLLVRSSVPHEGGSLPCELWPFVYSGVARVAVPKELLQRMEAHMDAAMSSRTADCSAGMPGEMRGGCQVRIEQPDPAYCALVRELCSSLAASIIGRQKFECKIDAVWGVVQKEGDYSPVQQHRCTSAPNGFTTILDVHLPACLSIENHDRPTKGSYGFHDGLHNILWKGDRTTDRNDLVQPGIMQLELCTGHLYVFPQRFQHMVYPFDGPGERKWVSSSVALCSVP